MEREGSGSIEQEKWSQERRKPTVRKLVAGGNHTLLLLDNGLVFVAGTGEGSGIYHTRPSPGSISLPTESAPSSTTVPRRSSNSEAREESTANYEQSALFRLVTLNGKLLKCSDIAATWEASILVLESRAEVYVFGKGLKGELGLGENITIVPEPTNLDLSELHLDLPASTTSSAAPRSSAEYEDGSNEKNVTITKVEAGMSHVVLLLNNGQAWGWGTSRKGELGSNNAVLKEKTPDSVLDIWKKMIWRPVPVEHALNECQGFNMEDIHCGKYFTIVIGTLLRQEQSMERKVGIFGDQKWVKEEILRQFLNIPYGTYSIIQNDKTGKQEWAKASPSSAPSSISIFTNWSTFHILNPPRTDVKPSDNSDEPYPGFVRSAGRHDHDQIIHKPLPPIKLLAGGSEHVVALTMDGKVISWGWGEHGNCGVRDENQTDNWNIIRMPEDLEGQGWRVVGVGAGCATTFCWLERP